LTKTYVLFIHPTLSGLNFTNMNKKVFHCNGKTILTIAVTSLLVGCNSELDLASYQQKEEKSIVSTNIDTQTQATTTDYLGKSFYLSSQDGEQSLLTTRTGIGAEKLTRSFVVNAESEQEKCLGVHVMAACVNEGKSLQKIEVWVNNEYVDDLDITSNEWQFVSLKNSGKIHLFAGKNTITFAANAPYYPEIDAIQVEDEASALLKEDPMYKDFIKQISAPKNLGNEKLDQDKVDNLLCKLAEEKAITRSAYETGHNWQVTPRTLENPDGNYQHKICVPITYTYHRKLSLTKGTYTFMTGPIDGDDFYSVDPVMYLYKIDDPHNYSYYNDDASGRGRHSQITATLPAGDYYLVIRAYSSSYASTTTGRQGLINVYQNGSILNSQTPVAGYVVDVDSPNTGIINYFTAYSSGIPAFYLEEKSSRKVKFFGETYFYVPPMEQMWFDDARLRLTKPSANDRYRMLVTCVGAFGAYYGNCDVYGSCQQVLDSDGFSKDFPNLKSNDAIYSSANGTYVYNCASWAGGLTYGWTWNGITANKYSSSLVGPNYGSPYIWDSWDAYFGNTPQRYAGAIAYTRDGAHSGNGVIAVWSTSDKISDVTHFSCRATANNQPHGYAWESKPGGARRIFHPRDALSGSLYGSIIAYYRDASVSDDPTTMATRGLSTANKLTFEESIKRGLTVIKEVTLTPEQENKISQITTRSSSSFADTKISALYNAWEKAISTPEHQLLSNPSSLIEIPEGKDFMDYCSKNKKEAFLFFAKLYFVNKEKTVAKEISYNMFCTLFTEYADIIEKVKQEWKEKQYDEKGAYIAPLPETFLKEYVKKLIDKLI
jgi:hypothetical protein